MLLVCLSNFDDDDFKLYKRFDVVFKIDLTLLIVYDVADDIKFSELSLLSFSNFRELFGIDDVAILSLKMNVFFSISFLIDDEAC